MTEYCFDMRRLLPYICVWRKIVFPVDHSVEEYYTVAAFIEV